jgi:cysteinyl-tRNA synthetase
MSEAYLGEVFDIHGGGLDLIFPHHENELAQSRCAHGTSKMANYWMHNGFLQVEGAKMSKSEGNFVTIQELLETDKFGGRKWSGAALRLAMLRTHYRSPMDWTVKALEEAEYELEDWHDALSDEVAVVQATSVLNALSDDLNTSLAITEIRQLVRAKNFPALAGALDLLGIRVGKDSDFKPLLRRRLEGAYDQSLIDNLVIARTAARARKDFKESDRIRDELAAMGIVIKDSKEGTTWEIAR